MANAPLRIVGDAGAPPQAGAKLPVAPAVIRGRVIETDLVRFGGRFDDVAFLAPDPHRIADQLPLDSASRMIDLYRISLDEVIDYLLALGEELRFDKNELMQEACAHSVAMTPVTPPLIEQQFRMIGMAFNRTMLDETIDCVGRPYLEGWAEKTMADGRIARIRAFGARTVHIVAGNGALISAMTIIRNAITRSDGIIKTPSNDPFTAIAIARTMARMAPDHPITRHLSVAYWKGGDEAFEQKLYQPYNVEKIVAWGGFASVSHVTRYIQPGLELISLDPKRSISIIGPEAFETEASIHEAALRLATDFGIHNQEGCLNSRVAYVCSGTDEAGIQRLEQFGQRVYDQLLSLPPHVSTPPKGGINPTLKGWLKAAALNDDWYTVIGGNREEGAVIVSKFPEQVEFAPSLTNRVINLVPMEAPVDVLPHVDAYCQTVGVYPDRVASELRDRLALHGAQRIVSLGYAGALSFGLPQDGLEPVRRMCKWINDEQYDPKVVTPLWK